MYLACTINLSKKFDKKVHDSIVELTAKIMELKLKEEREPNAAMKKIISRQSEGVNAMLDKAVYKLLNLSEKEVNLVEKE